MAFPPTCRATSSKLPANVSHWNDVVMKLSTTDCFRDHPVSGSRRWIVNSSVPQLKLIDIRFVTPSEYVSFRPYLPVLLRYTASLLIFRRWIIFPVSKLICMQTQQPTLQMVLGGFLRKAWNLRCVIDTVCGWLEESPFFRSLRLWCPKTGLLVCYCKSNKQKNHHGMLCVK